MKEYLKRTFMRDLSSARILKGRTWDEDPSKTGFLKSLRSTVLVFSFLRF